VNGDDAVEVDRPPAVTVVVPTFERAALLPRLVAALERQTVPPECFDVVVVDNASLDDTAACLAELRAGSPLRLRTLVETRQSPAAARNTGWRSSHAPLVAFIDDDCVPEPGWLRAGIDALLADERIGVVQGHTDKPAGAALGDWTLWRRVEGPTPYFEGLNIFYRRRALERAGGFDEDIGNYGEDAALGWAVLDAGWERGYADDALAYHDVEERGVRYHVRTGLLECNVARIAKRYPAFRDAAFWRPWAFRREGVAFIVALLGATVAVRRPAALVLVVPYLRQRMPPAGHPRRMHLMAERLVVDAARFAGMRAGSLRYRIAVL
jgi:glycosyltransferase involved in cell wall biosynthesis